MIRKQAPKGRGSMSDPRVRVGARPGAHMSHSLPRALSFHPAAPGTHQPWRFNALRQEFTCVALHTFHGGSSPLQGSLFPLCAGSSWESHFSRFIQRQLAKEAFQFPTLTLKSAFLWAGTSAVQILQNALEDLSNYAFSSGLAPVSLWSPKGTVL